MSLSRSCHLLGLVDECEEEGLAPEEKHCNMQHHIQITYIIFKLHRESILAILCLLGRTATFPKEEHTNAALNLVDDWSATADLLAENDNSSVMEWHKIECCLVREL